MKLRPNFTRQSARDLNHKQVSFRKSNPSYFIHAQTVLWNCDSISLDSLRMIWITNRFYFENQIPPISFMGKLSCGIATQFQKTVCAWFESQTGFILKIKSLLFHSPANCLVELRPNFTRHSAREILQSVRSNFEKLWYGSFPFTTTMILWYGTIPCHTF